MCKLRNKDILFSGVSHVDAVYRALSYVEEFIVLLLQVSRVQRVEYEQRVAAYLLVSVANELSSRISVKIS